MLNIYLLSSKATSPFLELLAALSQSILAPIVSMVASVYAQTRSCSTWRSQQYGRQCGVPEASFCCIQESITTDLDVVEPVGKQALPTGLARSFPLGKTSVLVTVVWLLLGGSTRQDRSFTARVLYRPLLAKKTVGIFTISAGEKSANDGKTCFRQNLIER